MELYQVIVLVSALILLGLVIYYFMDTPNKVETIYFPNTPDFPTRHTPYREQELTSVDEIMNKTRIPYYPRCEFPKTELPLP